MKNKKLSEEKKLIKAVMSIVIAIALIIPLAAILFTNNQGGYIATGVGKIEGTTPSPEPETPPEDTVNPGGSVFITPSGGNPGGGGGSGDDDDDDDLPTREIKLMPIFQGFWGLGVYEPGAEPISPVEGDFLGMGQITINPDGTQTRSFGKGLFVKGLYQSDEIVFRLLLNIEDGTRVDGTLTGTIAYDSTYDTTGDWYMNSGNLTAQFTWEDQLYWIHGRNEAA